METVEFNEYRATVLNLFGRYWDIAYQEASTGASMADEANAVIMHLEKHIRQPVASNEAFEETLPELPDVSDEEMLVPAPIALAIAAKGAIHNYDVSENLTSEALMLEYNTRWATALRHIMTEKGDAKDEFQEMRTLLLHVPTGKHYVLNWECYVSYHYAPPRIDKWYDPDENEPARLKRTFVRMSYELKKEW